MDFLLPPFGGCPPLASGWCKFYPRPKVSLIHASASEASVVTVQPCLDVLLDMQAVGLSGGLKFLVVVVAVVAYVLDAMNQIVEVRHLM